MNLQRARADQAVPPHPRGWSRCSRYARHSICGSPAPAGMVPRSTSASATSSWFPRTRGDGPGESGNASSLSAVPPHPRGWSRSARPPKTAATVPPHPRGWSVPPEGESDAAGGSPAPAGMVPPSWRQAPASRGFPRTRGDGPCSAARAQATASVPPHPRGWSRTRRRAHPGPTGSPAPAGMVPRGADAVIAALGFPRTRGDGPSSSIAIVTSTQVPPHPRGWSLGARLGGHALEGSPAPAGMVPCPRRRWPCRHRFPRTRGDGPCPWP